jgi:DNA polymerase III epsilon subunit-like protein
VQLEKLDLPTLAQHYRLEVQDAHHALADAFLTARIWQKMLHALQSNNVDTFGKLLRIAGA